MNTRLLIVGLVVTAALGAGCADEPEAALDSSYAFGECTRDEVVLRGEAIECAADIQCPCGSFCDTADQVCRFDCMVPPADPSESCASGSQCDDTGRCVLPGGPVNLTAVLSASPPSLHTVAGGASKTLQVRLTAFFSAALPAAQATVVRAIGQDGAEVSCNASAFAHECSLTGWTFSFDGAKYGAAKTLWVRTPAGTAEGRGEVELRVDATATEVRVPAAAGAATSPLEGEYVGSAISDGMPGGFGVTAVVRDRYLILRDPARVVAPDGALALEVALDDPGEPTERNIVWLRAPGAPDTAGAIVGEYKAGVSTSDPDTGALEVPFTIKLPAGQEEIWTLQLVRQADATDECATDAECDAGSVCPTQVHVCVPSSTWAPPPVPIDNKLEDTRSLAWWDAIDDLLGTGEVVSGPSKPAFATTGADLIETLLCTTAESADDAGRLGTSQVKFGGPAVPSRSGDLGCVNGDGTPNLAPGAVGLVTRADRRGDAVSSALLNTCLQDLARPVTDNFAINFNVNTGDCVNLARFVPALRLLVTGELGKRTQADGDGRARGLFTRLIQQWASLQGFLASTGLSQREYDDAVAATPAEARAQLLSLLDVLDANWAALLDTRIAPMFPTASTWAPTSSTDAEHDYRLLKRPIVYWPFNGPTSPAVDIIQGTTLNNQISLGCAFFPQSCPPPADACKILPSRSSLSQNWNCSGFSTGLPVAPAIGTGDDLTIVFNVDPLDGEFPPYAGGVLVATADLVVIYTFEHGTPELLVIHPTLDPNYPVTKEYTYFGGFGLLGHWTEPGVPAFGTSVALVRDTASKTYTLYTWQTDTLPDLHVISRSYTAEVGGALDLMDPRTLLVGNGTIFWPVPFWAPYTKSLAARIDDVAIFNSVMSRREFLRFAQTRNYVEYRRDVWPTDMSLVDHGTQEIAVPLGAALLEAQAAHLDVAARLVEHMKYEAQAACEDDDLVAGPARADLDAITARVGRTLRQSVIIEGFAAGDESERASGARQLLRAKRSQIGRRLHTLVSCDNPYGMGPEEVPLYFSNIQPNIDPKAAFFAASNFLLGLADGRAAAAQSALNAVQSAWNNARLSEIQQLQDDNSRAIRVGEVKSKYGDGLRRLCGMTEDAEQIMAQVNAGTFDVNTCFVKPTTACRAQSETGPIVEADPSCYRGALGGALMDMRASHHAQLAAYQNWQAAIGNAEAAERLCILKEIDAFGCSVIDRHVLNDVECPPNHQGTLELIEKFNDYLDEKETEKGWFDAVVHTISTISAMGAAYATTGPGGAFLVGMSGALSPLSDEMGRSMEQRKRRHEQMLAARAAEDAIRTCWNQSDQYQRAIAAAEEASGEATDRMQSAIIAFENGLAEAKELVLEGPVVVDRELTRPSIPIAFHYWLPDAIADYRFALESARRYAYVALRATEYDALDSYATAQPGKPRRSAVLGAWRPNTLQQQLQLMHDQTNTQTTLYGQPSPGHMTFDLGKKFFGITESSPDFGPTLLSYSRPVYSRQGEYLGLGVAFSLVPQSDGEAPTWRCAERIWRVNVGTAGYPSGGGDDFHLKLLKRNSFASRRCRAEGFRTASLRPGANLLVAAGEPQAYVPEATSVGADISVVRLDTGNALDDFRNRDDAYNGSSTELSLQGLYGDYVLLFPFTALGAGLDLTALFDFNLRFDFVSVDDTPPTLQAPGGQDRPRFEIQTGEDPIVIE